ncbi:MAG TPA: TetR/AcrR family transcriptional regulator [Acidobacteriaceae bacterium]
MSYIVHIVQAAIQQSDNDIEQVRPDSLRRIAILDAARPVFVRFGYRKTSMDDVARAAGVSRQGLYLHFANKEDLFRAAVHHSLGNHIAAARAILADTARPIESKLLAALNEWVGRYAQIALSGEAFDLIETSSLLAGPIIADHRRQFEQVLADAIGSSRPLMAVYSPAGLSALQIARTLHASTQGFANKPTSQEALIEDLTLAVQVLCAPLHRTVRKNP